MVRGIVALTVVASAACGRIGFDERGLAGAGGDGGSADAGPALACDPSKPFGPLVRFPAPVNSTSIEHAAYFSPDRLTLYISSQRAGGGDLFVITRADTASAWGAATPLATINSAQADTDMWVSADQLTIFFDSDRPATAASGNLYVATRVSPTDAFGSPALVGGVNTDGDDIDPWLSPAGDTLYFDSTVAGGVLDADLYRSARLAAPSSFQAPIAIAELNTPSHEQAPFLTADELTIYFATNRGKADPTDLDIWVAQRTTNAEPFGAPQPVPELNTTAGDWVTWLADDGCAVIVQSYVTAMDADVFYAEKPL